jgi:hypothetical protein
MGQFFSRQALREDRLLTSPSQLCGTVLERPPSCHMPILQAAVDSGWQLLLISKKRKKKNIASLFRRKLLIHISSQLIFTVILNP